MGRKSIRYTGSLTARSVAIHVITSTSIRIQFAHHKDIIYCYNIYGLQLRNDGGIMRPTRVTQFVKNSEFAIARNPCVVDEDIGQQQLAFIFFQKVQQVEWSSEDAVGIDRKGLTAEKGEGG